MVSFICDVCGDTLRKKQVDKHCSYVCRTAWELRCIECGMKFEGDEYKKHNECMTEVEKF